MIFSCSKSVSIKKQSQVTIITNIWSVMASPGHIWSAGLVFCRRRFTELNIVFAAWSLLISFSLNVKNFQIVEENYNCREECQTLERTLEQEQLSCRLIKLRLFPFYNFFMQFCIF